jgi:hypothetical protein
MISDIQGGGGIIPAMAVTTGLSVSAQRSPIADHAKLVSSRDTVVWIGTSAQTGYCPSKKVRVSAR